MAFEQLNITDAGRTHGPMSIADTAQMAQAGQLTDRAMAMCVATGQTAWLHIVLAPPQHEPGLELIAPVNIRNGLAFASGYLGLFSLVCVGPILGIPAVITGYLALQKPHLGGQGRAWTGIILGGLTTVGYSVLYLISFLG